MNEKPWYLSLGVIGSLVAIIVFGAKLFGLDLQSEQENLTTLLTNAAGIIAGVVALIGRLRATKTIKPISGTGAGIFLVVILLLGLLLVSLAGCTSVWMDSGFKDNIEGQVIVIESLDKECLAGNDGACRAGLHAAAQSVRLILDAANGVDPNEGGR